MMSLHANMGGGKKRYTPDEFNPFAAQRKKGSQVQSNEDVAALKQRLMARNRARTTE